MDSATFRAQSPFFQRPTSAPPGVKMPIILNGASGQRTILEIRSMRGSSAAPQTKAKGELAMWAGLSVFAMCVLSVAVFLALHS